MKTKYEWLAIDYDEGELTGILNRVEAEGWEVFAVTNWNVVTRRTTTILPSEDAVLLDSSTVQ